MMHGIEVVLFDMGGTLRGTRKRSREERLLYTGKILQLLGSSEDPAKFSRRLARRATAYRQWARETLLELNEDELWTRWMLPDWPETQVRKDAVRLNSLWREATGVRNIFPETADVIHEIYRRGYRIGLVSNTTSSSETSDALAKAGLTGYFETIVLSSVFGKRKPDPAILLDATERMGVIPEKCVYVGDLLHRDITAARKAGIGVAILIHRRVRRRSSQTVDPHIQADYEIKNLRELLDVVPARVPPRPMQVYAASVSSMWAIKRFGSFRDFLETSRRLGFREVELNHQVDSQLLDGVGLDEYSFSSIHEPCPADISAPELKKRDWLISSTVEECRVQGVESIQRSIDLACKLKARVIVIHAGVVHPDRELENRLRSLYEAGQNENKEYQEIKQALIRNRLVFAPDHLEAARKSLSDLLDYAAGSGICLGVENRFHYYEIPSPDELEEFLMQTDPQRLGFIYDVGHSQALSSLGFYTHDEWLKRFSRRMIAVHLHDMKDLNDHRLPGQGEVDFDLLAKYLPKDTLRTLEFQGHYTQEQVHSCLEFLRQHGCIEKLDH
jgi:HAD superfamily hydrolase (TIGR01549 family)